MVAERSVVARLSTSRLNRKGGKNSALGNARVDPKRRATKTHLAQGTTEEIGELVPETSRDTEVKETNQSGFDPAGVKSLRDVDERGKGVLMAAEAQGVHEAEGHGVGTPTETALGRIELWKNVGRNASINQVLEDF